MGCDDHACWNIRRADALCEVADEEMPLTACSEQLARELMLLRLTRVKALCVAARVFAQHRGRKMSWRIV
jgi:hypothetical protein